MKPYYEDATVTLYAGDCLDVLRELPDNSVDAVVCDPPYGLANTTPGQVAETFTRWVNGERDYLPGGAGFMGKAWDAFVPPVAVWDDCFRVLKPGGYALVFAGTRTQDLMGMSLRLAGFEIRDSLAWLYGSGFPKSLDVSKAIDKAAPRAGMFDAFAAHFASQWAKSGLARRDFVPHFPHYKNAESVMAQLSNWKLAKNVPSRQDFTILRGLIGLSDEWEALIERVEAEREVITARTMTQGGGTSLQIRMGEVREVNADITAPATDAARTWAGWGTALKPAHEPILMARKPLVGTVAANVLAHGTGALNIDGTRVAHGGDVDLTREQRQHSDSAGFGGSGMKAGHVQPLYAEGGRWPANVVLDESQAEVLDEQSGWTRDGSTRVQHGFRSEYVNGEGSDAGLPPAGYGGAGGASRFFYVAERDFNCCKEGESCLSNDAPSAESSAETTTPSNSGGGSHSTESPTTDPTADLQARFLYAAKAPKKERPVIEHPDGTRTAHPTVKPVALMRWLVRLVTPPGGIVLDPFAGSGTTLEAALLEGFRCIGVERETDYLPLITQRIGKFRDAKAETGEGTLFDLLGGDVA